MKIAGRRNAGAWYRTNKFLKIADADERTALATLIGDLDTLPAFVAAINDIATRTGVSLPGGPLDQASYADTLSKGIPLQVWMGVLTFDTYTLGSNSAGDPVYKPDHQSAARAFATDLRYLFKQYYFASRELKDVLNVATRDDGNPGGIADATKGN